MEIKTTVEKIKVVTEVERQVNQFILNDEEIKAFYLLFGCMGMEEIEKFLLKTVAHYKNNGSAICNGFSKERSKQVLIGMFEKVSDEYRRTGVVKTY